MSRLKPVICILTAGFLWGCIPIFINGLAGTGLSTVGISSVRLFSAAIVYIVFLLIKDKKQLHIHLRDIWMFILSGVVSIALFNYLYSYTVIHSEASIAVVLLYTSPIFTMLLSAVFFKDKLTMKSIICLVLVFAGCVMVSGLLGGTAKLYLPVFLTGLGSGLFWGAYTIFSRISLKKYSSMTVSAWSMILAGAVMIPFGIAEKVPAQIVQNPTILLWGFGIAAVSTVTPFALYTYGLQYIDSGKAAIMATFELVVGNIVGMVLYHDSHEPIKILGILLSIAAIIILNLEFHKKVVDK